MCKIIIFLCIPQWCNQILGGLNTTPVFPIGRATDQSGLAYQPKGDLVMRYRGIGPQRKGLLISVKPNSPSSHAAIEKTAGGRLQKAWWRDLC
jgi:hypothetical protein